MVINFHNTTVRIALFVAIMGILLLTVVSVFSSSTSAAPVDVLTQCNSQSQVCKGTDKNSLSGIVKNVINLLLFVVGIISVFMIIIAGFRYATSAGDAGQTKSARDTIIYAVVGLVVAVMAFSLVNFVLGRI